MSVEDDIQEILPTKDETWETSIRNLSCLFPKDETWETSIRNLSCLFPKIHDSLQM